MIVAIEDQPVRRFEDLVSYLVTKATPGDTARLTLLRDGERMEVPVVLGERPAIADADGAEQSAERWHQSGGCH